MAVGAAGDRRPRGRTLRPPAWLPLLAAALLGGAASCSPSSDAGTIPPRPARAAASSAFTAPTPPGYAFVAAGTGTTVPDWSEDSFGTVEPFTVVTPRTGAAHVVVSVTGYRGYEGGLDQASAGYGEPDLDWRPVLGHAARFAAGDQGARARRPWADLVVAHRSDLAVRTSGPYDRRTLVSWEERTVPAKGHLVAPSVRLPSGAHLVGHVDADVVQALGAFVVRERPDVASVPPSGHFVGWCSGDASIVAATLPAGSADVRALAGSTRFGMWIGGSVRTFDDPQPAASLEQLLGPECHGCNTIRVVVTTAPWGDVVVVNGQGVTAPPSEQTLLAVARSLRRA